MRQLSEDLRDRGQSANVRAEKSNTNMAEENTRSDDARFFGLDDMSVMRELLQSVRGLSPISLAPVIDEGLSDDRDRIEQYQFE